MWEVHGDADLHKVINENADKAVAVYQVELSLNLSAQKSQSKSTCPYLILNFVLTYLVVEQYNFLFYNKQFPSTSVLHLLVFTF